MTLFSILFALLARQFKALRGENPFNAAVESLSLRMEAWFNAGQAKHGQLAWLLAMTVVMLPVALIYWLCLRVHPMLALVWNVVVLYFTLDFRRDSDYFTAIQLAMNAGDDKTARKLLAQWTGLDTATLGVADVARLAIEQALTTSHRHVFGVFFWFVFPLGPACAVMYRVADYLSKAWSESESLKNEGFGLFASRAFYCIDWIPSRLTAITFAIVGNFEDAIYAWRNFASYWQDEAVGILLSAGSGAMGVRLGAATQTSTEKFAADSESMQLVGADMEGLLGEEATARALQSTIGLIWRALFLWLLLVLLLSITSWMGKPATM